MTIEHPSQLNFRASPERIARLDYETGFRNLVKNAKTVEGHIAGTREQELIKSILSAMPADLFKNRADFSRALKRITDMHRYKPSAPICKAILSALSERDDTAPICRDRKGNPEADSSLRDVEYVPLTEDIQEYFAREVAPHVPDAWINSDVVDEKDRNIGKVGYRINFNRYFYQHQPPRPLEDINADICQLEEDIVAMFREVLG